MELLHEDNGRKGRFYMKGPTHDLAEIVYSYDDANTIIIEHTEADLSLKGQGVGAKLVEAVVEWARTRGFKIIPICPFAKKVFERRADYKDVLFEKL